MRTNMTTSPSPPASSLLGDLRTLKHLLFTRIRGGSHEERLESFYSGQAGGYDSFRARLLHGRRELIQAIDFPAAGVWVDLGAGTGENAEHLGPRLQELRQVYQVDLSESLLDQARGRVAARGWSNVTPVKADATRFLPPEGQADVVTFSYSLTMIPDWFQAVQQAIRMLRPGGLLGVVDFYVSRKYPDANRTRHGWFTRSFWPVWFAGDNVFLNPDHLPFLTAQLETVSLYEGRGGIPWLPFLRVPYYWFVGRKPED